jgi:hypothetical protein
MFSLLAKTGSKPSMTSSSTLADTHIAVRISTLTWCSRVRRYSDAKSAPTTRILLRWETCFPNEREQSLANDRRRRPGAADRLSTFRGHTTLSKEWEDCFGFGTANQSTYKNSLLISSTWANFSLGDSGGTGSGGGPRKSSTESKPRSSSGRPVGVSVTCTFQVKVS